MNALMSFLFGIIILASAAGIVLAGGKIFDASREFAVVPVIFQPADLSRDRIEKPISLDVLSDEFVRNSLIKKYVHEYFYIIPDSGDMARRRAANSALQRMSNAGTNVFKEWSENFAPEMERLATQNVLRRAIVTDISEPPNSEYLQVSYDLLTWDVSNDITRAPHVAKDNLMFIRIDFEKSLRKNDNFDVKKYLEDGGDPATMFRFRVNEVVMK